MSFGTDEPEILRTIIPVLEETIPSPILESIKDINFSGDIWSIFDTIRNVIGFLLVGLIIPAEWILTNFLAILVHFNLYISIPISILIFFGILFLFRRQLKKSQLNYYSERAKQILSKSSQ